MRYRERHTKVSGPSLLSPVTRLLAPDWYEMAVPSPYMPR